MMESVMINRSEIERKVIGIWVKVAEISVYYFKLVYSHPDILHIKQIGIRRIHKAGISIFLFSKAVK